MYRREEDGGVPDDGGAVRRISEEAAIEEAALDEEAPLFHVDLSTWPTSLREHWPHAPDKRRRRDEVDA